MGRTVARRGKRRLANPDFVRLAVAAVFLVLAALYESWSIPLAVILVIPLGLIGAAAGVTGRNLFEGLLGSVPSFANDIYFQVGFVTVMGLSAKNAILIIELPKTFKRKGKARSKPLWRQPACVSVRLS
ncbi:antibiotic resistance efflux pump component [Neisseria gonorrhoeae]|nr:antibiotic resistance efflux pump component [Neisseria gonorrhoeae]